MPRFTTRPEILGTFRVVASTHWLATAAGMAVLEQGGNAFDAAVATGFALQVVEPHLNGPGGDVPIIVNRAGTDRVDVICGQGTAPASLQAFRDLGLDIVPGTGLLPAVVPGAFDAWMLLLRDWGTMRPREVMQYAIGYARDGYALVPNICNTIDHMQQVFRDEWPSSAEIWLPGGDVPAAGTRFCMPALADTYERVLSEAESAGADREAQIEAARRTWSQGFVAEAIDSFFRTAEIMDTSGTRHRGLLSGDDIAGWQATVEAPATYDYHGYTVCKTGPWGQDPALLQQLALLKGIDFSCMQETDPDFVHYVMEAAKLAFADREAFYADPDFVEVPMDVLLGDAYNDVRRGLIGDTASLEIRPGEIPGFGGTVVVREKGSTAAGGPGVGEPTVAKYTTPAPSALGAGKPDPMHERGATKGDTCHFDIIDRDGNMVGGTPSGGWLQSSPAVPGLGFCLTNRGQMFWLDESSPACIAPGKRPRTTLSVNLALRDGEPYMVFGTPGGDQQDQWSLQFFLRHVHFGLNLQEAIDAPSFHTAHFPSSFYPRECDPGHLALEGRFPASTIDELARRGHRVEVQDDWSIGRMSAAARDGDLLKAAANPRFMQGYAAGR